MVIKHAHLMVNNSRKKTCQSYRDVFLKMFKKNNKNVCTNIWFHIKEGRTTYTLPKKLKTKADCSQIRTPHYIFVFIGCFFFPKQRKKRLSIAVQKGTNGYFYILHLQVVKTAIWESFSCVSTLWKFVRKYLSHHTRKPSARTGESVQVR